MHFSPAAVRAAKRIAESENWHFARKIALDEGFEVTKVLRGLYRKCLLGHSECIKLPLKESALEQHEDYTRIARFRRSPRRIHFPAIRIISPKVCIQELCPIDTRRFFQQHAELERLASALGVEDLHEYNVGWRGATPVFFDISYRFNL